MFYKLCRQMKNQKGFTLVELMVVVIIIGVLVAIAVPVYNTTQDKAKTNADKANVRILDGATAAYAADNDKAITDCTEEELIANDGSGLVPKYLQALPESPKKESNESFTDWYNFNEDTGKWEALK